jgi:hypothetical protein
MGRNATKTNTAAKTNTTMSEPFLSIETDPSDTVWEIRKIVGKKYLNGAPYYLVDWSPTLEPKKLLPKELIDEFEERIKAQYGAKHK